MPGLDVLKPSSIGAKKRRPFISLLKKRWRNGVKKTRNSFSLHGEGDEERQKSKANGRNCTPMTNRNNQTSCVAKRIRSTAMTTTDGKKKGERCMASNGTPMIATLRKEKRYCFASTGMEALESIFRIKPGSSMNAHDRYGNNLLHQSFTNVDPCAVTTLEHIKYLLDMKPTLATERNKQGFLPLHFAIKHIYNNKNAFRQHIDAQAVIVSLCMVDPRMVSVKNCDGDDAFDLADHARTRKASMSWLYYILQKIQFAWYRKQKLEWESKRFLKEEINSTSSCDPSCGTLSTMSTY